ncbi:MAG: hypothetical protein DYG89_18820 [Caldilinea sp. CFX5]|nr:hypothetical protein [Caldilinea sp. CFX5]
MTEYNRGRRKVRIVNINIDWRSIAALLVQWVMMALRQPQMDRSFMAPFDKSFFGDDSIAAIRWFKQNGWKCCTAHFCTTCVTSNLRESNFGMLEKLTFDCAFGML